MINFGQRRKIMGISDEMIRAAIQTGQFGDPERIEFLTNALIQRRTSIARTYLPAVNPIVDPVLSDDGTLNLEMQQLMQGLLKHPRITP